MKQMETVKKMFNDILGHAAIKSIVKSRGFPQHAAVDSTLFSQYYLSGTGIDEVLSALTSEELVILHLLRDEHSSVPVSFFKRVYSSSVKVSYGTFAQKYSNLFKVVEKSLLRRGLLLVEASRSGNSKLEQYRFSFPEQFDEHLPSFLGNTMEMESKEKINDSFWRGMLKEFVTEDKPHLMKKNNHRFYLLKGQLYLGNELFTLSKLSREREKGWRDEVSVHSKEALRGEIPWEFEKSLEKALSTLPDCHWIEAEHIKSFVKVFFLGKFEKEAGHILEQGWKHGILVKSNQQGVARYRLLKAEDMDAAPPDTGLSLTSDNTLCIDLKTIPFEKLAILCTLSSFNSKGDTISATPDAILIGRASESVLEHPFSQWLKSNMPPYIETFREIEKKRGKLILHDNLLFAKVADLSLRVQIQKACKDSKGFLLLPNDFIAFVPDLMDIIQKAVIKSGFAVKEVS